MSLRSKRAFLQDIAEGNPYPLYKEIAFAEPYTYYEALKTPNSLLLESVKGPEKIARYSFIGVDPYLTFRTKDGVTEITSGGDVIRSSMHPFRLLRPLLRAVVKRAMGLPPFIAGAAGLIGYDFAHYLERLPRTVRDDLHTPDMHLLFFDTILCFDHIDKKAWITSCPWVKDINKWTLQGRTGITPAPDASSSAEYYDEALERIALIESRLYVVGETDGKGAAGKIEIRHELSKSQYMDMVKRAKQYIAAGDIFQANISQRISADIKGIEPWDIYKKLCSINPSPFSAFLHMGDYLVVSSSPERLLRVNDGIIETRPIAGTRPRGKDNNGDRLMRAELLINGKERAEHIMLIDLERNDLGKVSEYGSVTVDELMITEDYSHVIHIVSNIRGCLKKGKDLIDAIRAAFPGGTITGVPKVRCMEIIDELESTQRGPYTGSIGYMSFTGDMDLNIVIRSFVIKDDTAYVHAGGGIVADSEPEREYYETLKKAEALIKSLEEL